MKKTKTNSFKNGDWSQWLEEEKSKKKKEYAIYLIVSVSAILAAYITLILI